MYMKRQRNPLKKARRILSIKSKYLVITRRRFFWFLLYISIAAFILWLFFGGLFTVQNISCKRDDESCNEQVNAELSRLQGQSTLIFKSDEMKVKLKKADPSIAEVNIETNLPNSLQVNIKSRDPQAFISFSDSQKGFVIDRQGYIFATAMKKNPSIPIIIVENQLDLSIGERIENPTLLGAVSLTQTLQEQLILFKKMIVSDNKLEVLLSDQIEVLFSPEQDFVKQVTSLQQILAQATIGEEPTLIDVRFQKPVVSTKKLPSDNR